jgi:hypothetical protein
VPAVFVPPLAAFVPAVLVPPLAAFVPAVFVPPIAGLVPAVLFPPLPAFVPAVLVPPSAAAAPPLAAFALPPTPESAESEMLFTVQAEERSSNPVDSCTSDGMRMKIYS